MPLGLATFVPESFALGQLVRFQQDVPCSADSEVQAPQRAGVIWCCSTPGSLSPAVAAALCRASRPTVPLRQCKASPFHLPCLFLVSSHQTAHGAAADTAQRSIRVRKSLVSLVFKMPINITGSWAALRRLIWHVPCYPAF